MASSDQRLSDRFLFTSTKSSLSRPISPVNEAHCILSRSRTVDSALAGTFEGGAEHEDSLLNLRTRKVEQGILSGQTGDRRSEDRWSAVVRHLRHLGQGRTGVGGCGGGGGGRRDGGGQGGW